ncbi:MAG: hypothetical protein P4K86_01010 [Terracidiphilus sp.]|nr:hypothetical protein [Terracidiphilus sp.]MDR3775935.1 hypothetical protein [Terracidiphilus sp.]
MAEVGRQEFTLRQRLISYIFLFFGLGVLAWMSVRSAQLAFELSDLSWWIRGSFLAVSGLLAYLALYLAVSLIRRKWKTGRFLLTGSEVVARQAEYRSRLGAGKPFWPQARYWILPFLLIFVLLALGTLAIVAAFCFGPSSQPKLLLLLVSAALLLAVPFWSLCKAIRRKLKTGSFLPSEQELDAWRARCAKPKSLRQRIALAAVWWFSAILWTDIAIGRQHRQGSAWVAAGVTWVAALMWTWQAFRPSPSQCALPAAPQEPPTPPEA